MLSTDSPRSNIEPPTCVCIIVAPVDVRLKALELTPCPDESGLPLFRLAMAGPGDLDNIFGDMTWGDEEDGAPPTPLPPSTRSSKRQRTQTSSDADRAKPVKDAGKSKVWPSVPSLVQGQLASSGPAPEPVPVTADSRLDAALATVVPMPSSVAGWTDALTKSTSASSALPTCAVCGETPGQTPFSRIVHLGAKVSEVTDACVRCVLGATVLSPGLLWAEVSDLAQVAPDFRTGVMVAGTIARATAPSERTPQQTMALMSGQQSQDKLPSMKSLVAESLGVTFASSDAAQGALCLPQSPKTKDKHGGLLGAVGATSSPPPKKPPTPKGRGEAKGSTQLVRRSGSLKLLSEPCDRNSLQYHMSKLPLDQVLEGKISKVGNLINAAEATSAALRIDRTGMRVQEGEDLALYTKRGAAADLLSERRMPGLTDIQFAESLTIIKSANMSAYPVSFCRRVLRRIMFKESSPKLIADMAWPWPSSDAGEQKTGFDIMAPTVRHLPGSMTEKVTAMEECIVGDFLCTMMRPKADGTLDDARLDRMCKVAGIFARLWGEVSGPVSASSDAARVLQVVSDLGAVSSLIAPGGLNHRATMDALQSLRTDAEKVTARMQASFRQVVGQRLREGTWHRLSDEFLTSVLHEVQHEAERNTHVQRLADVAAVDVTEDQAQNIMAAASRWPALTRPQWIRPLLEAWARHVKSLSEAAMKLDIPNPHVLNAMVRLAHWEKVLDANAESATACCCLPATKMQELRTALAPRAERIRARQKVEEDKALLKSMAEELGGEQFSIQEWKAKLPHWTDNSDQDIKHHIELAVRAALAGVLASPSSVAGTAGESPPPRSGIDMLGFMVHLTKHTVPELSQGFEAMILQRRIAGILDSLEQARKEADQKKKTSLMKGLLKSLTSIELPMQGTMGPALTRAGATESQIQEELERVQQVVRQREETMLQAAQARAQHSHLALVSATSELALISGGAPDGAYWADGTQDFDSLVQKSQALFASFDAAATEHLAGRVKRAANTYRKDAAEGNIAEKDVSDAITAAQGQVKRSTATLKEAQFMAAVLTGGQIGLEQCRVGLASMAHEHVATTSVHAVLFAEAQRLMRTGGPSSSSSSCPAAGGSTA